MQDQAQFIYRGRGNRFPMRHTAERVAADAIVVDQGIFCDASLFHCFPAVIIVNHRNPSDTFIVCYM